MTYNLERREYLGRRMVLGCLSPHGSRRPAAVCGRRQWRNKGADESIVVDGRLLARAARPAGSCDDDDCRRGRKREIGDGEEMPPPARLLSFIYSYYLLQISEMEGIERRLSAPVNAGGS